MKDSTDKGTGDMFGEKPGGEDKRPELPRQGQNVRPPFVPSSRKITLL